MQHSDDRPHSFRSAFHALSLGLALAGALAGCSQPEPPAQPVRSVKVIQVGSRGQQAQGDFAGEVKARVESALGFRVAGKVISRAVQLGQTVQAGQVLAQLDPQDYSLASQAAQAQVSAAQTNRDLAAADVKRFQDLHKQGFISATELERREAAWKAAQAQWEQAQAQAAMQTHQRDYTTLRADVAGVVTAVDVEAGQVVSAGMTVVRLAQKGPRDAVFALPEDMVNQMTVGSRVQVRVWGTGGVTQGSVRERAAAADPVTRTFTVKVGLPEDFTAPLGSTVTVQPLAVGTGAAPVLALPTQALRQDGQHTAVWVLDMPTMQVRSVNVSVVSTDMNEVVIGSGLTPGQWVVATGVHVLTPGQKVSLYQERGAPPSALPAASAASRAKGA